MGRHVGWWVVVALFIGLFGGRGDARGLSRARRLEILAHRLFWEGRDEGPLRRLPDGPDAAEQEALVRACIRRCFPGLDPRRALRRLDRDGDGDGLSMLHDPDEEGRRDLDGDGLADAVDLAPRGPGSAFPWIPPAVVAAQESLLRAGVLYVPSLLGVAPGRIENLLWDLPLKARWAAEFERCRRRGRIFVLRESSLYLQGFPQAGDRDYDGLPDAWDAEPLGPGSRRDDDDGDGLVNEVDLSPQGPTGALRGSAEDRRWQELFWREHGMVVHHARHRLTPRALETFHRDLVSLGAGCSAYRRSPALRVLLASSSRGLNSVLAWYDPARATLTIRRPSRMTRRLWMHELGHVSEEIFKPLAVEHHLALRRRRPAASRRDGEEDFAWAFADWVLSQETGRRRTADLRRIDDVLRRR